MATAFTKRDLWTFASDAQSTVKNPTLDGCPVGQAVRIRVIVGDREVCKRLLELGFTPGHEVTPIVAIPLGGPIAIALRGTLVALRRAEAACIEI